MYIPPFFSADGVRALAHIVGESVFAVGFHEEHDVVDADGITASHHLGGFASQSSCVVTVTDLGRNVGCESVEKKEEKGPEGEGD